MFITAKISKYMVPANRLFVMAVQKRVSSTSTVLGSMKETKMLGVVQPWTNALRDLMENQIAKAKMQRLIFACTIVLGMDPFDHHIACDVFVLPTYADVYGLFRDCTNPVCPRVHLWNCFAVLRLQLQ